MAAVSTLQSLLPGVPEDWTNILINFLKQTLQGGQWPSVDQKVSIDPKHLPRVLQRWNTNWTAKLLSKPVEEEEYQYMAARLSIGSCYDFYIGGLGNPDYEPIKTVEVQEKLITKELVQIAATHVDTSSPGFVCLLASETLAIAVWKTHVIFMESFTAARKINTMVRSTFLRLNLVALEGDNVQSLMNEGIKWHRTGQELKLTKGREFVLLPSMDDTVMALLMCTHLRLNENCNPLVVEAMQNRDVLQSILMLLVPETASQRDVQEFMLRQ